MASGKICPISKKMCTNCSLYIGRHYYTCMTKDESSRKIVQQILDRKQRYTSSKDDGKFGQSDFDNVPKTGSWYQNIEDIYIKGEA
jgi:hypothetical protein